MNQIEWISNLYQDVCMKYIENKPESAKEDLEKILFLMQYDSLQDKKKYKPMIRYKIYIDNEHIRIRYFSDLLRVTRFMPKFWHLPPSARFSYHSLITASKYESEFNKYRKLPKEKLEDKVKEILSKGDLNPKYFVYGAYTDKFMRRVARLMLYNAEHRVRGFLWLMWLILFVMPFFVMPSLVNELNDRAYFLQIYLRFLVINAISISFWFLWTRKITQPTAYELENS